MILPASIPALVLALEPVRIVTPTVESPAATTAQISIWVWIVGAVVALALVVAFGVLATGAVTAYRRIRTLHPAEDAFRSLCKSMRIPPDQWPALRALAAKIDAAPAAILISRTAFDRAAGSKAAGAPQNVAGLRSRLFGDDAHA